jgi:hypothetical protein
VTKKANDRRQGVPATGGASTPEPIAEVAAREEDPFEARYASLLARRVPLEAIEMGRAYVIHARNGSVGVAVREDDRVGYCLHREKWGDHYLFTEVDWDERPRPGFFPGTEMLGTAIPLLAIEAKPPKGQKRLLAWLTEQEDKHKAVGEEAWRVVLGPAAFSRLRRARARRPGR